MTRFTQSEQLVGIVAETPSGRAIYLLDLVDSWARQMALIAAEAGAPLGSMPDTRTADDFVGALYTRSRLEKALAMVDGEVSLGSVMAADELFRRFTVFDGTETLRRVYDDAPLQPWWWQRVPTSGPIYEELIADYGYKPDAASQ